MNKPFINPYWTEDEIYNVWVVSVIDRRGEAGHVIGVFNDYKVALEFRRNHSLQLMDWELVIIEALKMNDPDLEPRQINDPLYVQSVLTNG